MVPRRRVAAAAAPARLARGIAIGLTLLLSFLGIERVWAQPVSAPLLAQPMQPPWTLTLLPNQKPAPTRFSVESIDGREALKVESLAGYGTLVHELMPAAQRSTRLWWQWRVDVIPTGADLRRRDGDDAALKVCVLLDLPLDRVPFVERQLLRLAQLRSGLSLPTATLCYVWDAQLGAGTVLPNAYTRRLRFLVLRGPEVGVGRWMTEERDLARDVRQVFGDETSELPRVRAVLIGADADNTGSRSLAYLRDLSLEP